MDSNIDDTAIPPSGYLVGKPLLYFTSVFVSLGVFLFGYDQGVMSGIITGPYFKYYFNDPSSTTIGTMVAILEIGALISSLLVGRMGDIIGRRRTIRYGAFIFVVGGSIQTFATDMHHLILGRIVSGVAVGLLSATVPVYQSEISQPHNRGQLSCVQFTGNIFGYATSVWTDYGCSFFESNLSWRFPLFVQCVIGLLLFLGTFVIVETPRWLLNNDHDAEGIVVLADLYSNGDVHDIRARNEFRNIKEDVLMSRLEDTGTSYSYMWKRYKTRILIAMSSQMFAQFNGINVISYYAPLVFEQAGWFGRDAILMTGINSIIYFASSIPPWYLVDRWGRKPILIIGGIIMAISLFSISFVLFINVPKTPVYVVILVIIYNALFGFSWGPIPWLLPPEILPLSIRSKGASLSTATNWFCNFLVGELTPVLQETIKWRLYLIHGTSCVLSFLVVHYIYPETKGLTLEDMDSVFDDRSSTFSFQSSNSVTGLNQQQQQQHPGAGTGGFGTNYGSITNEDGLPVQYQSPAVLARHPIVAAQQAQNLKSSTPSLRSTSNYMNNVSPLIQPHELEPPNIEEIRAYKLSDNNSIKGNIRRSSENIGSMFHKVFNNNSLKRSDSTSEFTNDSEDEEANLTSNSGRH
ncbi:hypothetical protein PACTADRAFT_50287 [Pachysolen tannophilus NRRL Y-2460]|uniref:Major facilitator superfamily (MFS) profile domain-containing protein n=1 Tax=Pachysolen tannophilus NRRL Y-2460 TaxID=669874 RepID=A0A1E4TV30_PACTA|nr:hypothetical protein PACTADRAFT_50287 [Pachysolen tannophilus NRRL Y-2460]